MKIPENFKKKLAIKENEEKKERMKEIEEDKKEKITSKKYKEKEKKYYDEKLKLSKKIFEWCKEFLSSREGSKMVKNSVFDTFTLFNYGWGHSFEKIDGGGWSVLLLYKKGDLSYRAGYKWMGFRAYHDMKKAEEMASILNYEYLKKLWMHIDSEEVFKTLEKEL